MRNKTTAAIFTILFAVLFWTGAVCAQTVNIPDPNLESAIRDALEKPEGDITVADMESLTELWAGNKGIEDLAGLEYATNLTNLDLNNNEISDISSLSSLTNLIELHLVDNDISDISPLSGLTKIDFLNLDPLQA